MARVHDEPRPRNAETHSMPAPQTPALAPVAFAASSCRPSAGSVALGHRATPDGLSAAALECLRPVPWGSGSVARRPARLRAAPAPVSPLNRLIMGPEHTLAETREEQPDVVLIEQLLV